MRIFTLLFLLCSGLICFGQEAKDTILIKQLREGANEDMDNGAYFDALEKYVEHLNLHLNLYGEKHSETANAYIHLCTCNINLSRFKTAKEYCQKAQSIFQQLNQKESKYYADVLAELGGGYHSIGDYQASIDYYQKSRSLYESHFDDFGIDSSYLSYVYYNIGNTYLGLNKADAALDYMAKALAIDKIYGGDEYVADDLDNIAAAYEMKGNYTTAIKYYNEAIDLYIKSLGKKHDYTAHAMQLKAECLTKMGNYKAAQPLLFEALKINKSVLGEKHRDVANIYSLIGTNHIYASNYDAALIAFDNALKAIEYDPKNIENRYKNVSTIYDLISIFKAYANAHFKIYKSNNEIVHLNESNSIIKKAIQLLDHLRSDFRQKGSKVNLLSKANSVFEIAINVQLELKKKHPEKAEEHLATIFQLIEQSKSILLLENQSKANAEKYAGIPAALLQKEHDLVADLNYYEEKLLELKETENTDNQQNKLNGEIFNLKEAYQKLIEQFEKDYPDYYQLKYQLDIVDLKNTQQNVLKENTTLIEYFVGDSTIFIATINKNSINVDAIKNDFQLVDLVNQMRSGILDYHLANSNDQSNELYKKTISLYQKSAFQLYQRLIQPLEKYNLSHQLIIVPDGILGYLPFDALLSNTISENASFKQYPYLFKTHQISYIYSATLLAEMEKKLSNKDCETLAVAPIFPKIQDTPNYLAIRQGLGALKFNIPESEAVIKQMGGQLLQGNEANKTNFLNYAANYCILHLSTHGKANDEVGDASFLAFSEIKDSTDYNDKLFVRELYNLKLNADMVVLSACETGVGELQKGEGIVSLARGFAYAGAKSIITTLWSVDDAETKNIITRFYKNIKAGQSKDAALHQARVNYLKESSNIKAHPFYWAAYIPLGDMTPIQTANSRTWLWIIGGLVIVSLIAFFGLKRKQQSL